MSTASDRRAQNASRIPFDGMVEIGGALGPSFEAQAVNLSEEGMHLRTAYLPEVGQPVTCRFDAGQGLVVVAAGEVLWNDDRGECGEFGIRFTNLDAQSTVALQRIVGMVEDGMTLHPPHGRKVRLHIEGLASPMRARVKATEGSSVTAFSELGFLQVGKQLDLEDAATGDKRPALIDRVAVEVESGTRIPQLIVTLKYDDEEAQADAAEALPRNANVHDMYDEDVCAAATPDNDGAHANYARSTNPGLGGPSGIDDEDPYADDVAGEYRRDEALDDEMAPVHASARESRRSFASIAPRDRDDTADEDARNMKSSFARNAAKVTPALSKWAKRAKTTVALLAARARAKRDARAEEAPIRRTTAPAPGGGLHTAGRKVVRGEVEDRPSEEARAKRSFPITKKRALVGTAIGLASIVAVVAMRKPEAPAAVATPAPETTAPAAPAQTAPAPLPTTAPAMPMGPIDSFATNGSMGGANGANGSMGAEPTPAPRPGKVAPFGNGPVTRGNVLKIKMDGPIARIHGASQPAGFTVVIPGRKSLDAAGPLAARDSRIAAIRVSNENNGAELAVTFKDGVPNYQVKARGETLELHLAKPGRAGDKAPEAHAKPRHKKKH